MSETGRGIAAYPALNAAREALDAGRTDEAAQRVLAHLRQHNGEPRGLALLGSVALASGAFSQAEKFLREAISRGADDHDVKRTLARCLSQQDRLGDALEMYGQISSKEDWQTKLAIAWLNDKLGRHDFAQAAFARFVEEHPNEATGWISYGLSLRSAGLVNQAVDAFRTATRLQPTLGQPWWELASIKSDVLDDDIIASLESAMPRTLDVSDKAFQHFALGRAFHQRERFADAFANFAEANRLMSEDLSYDPTGLTAEIEEIEQLYGPGYFDALPAGGDPSEAPIFIVSLPRAGSTLVEQMLGSHPDVEALGELTYVPSLIRLMMERATIRGPVTFTQAIAAMTPAERTELGAEYLRRASAHRRTDASRFTDKMPHNWSNLLFLRHILPNAKFVEVRRPPVAWGFANFSHWFTRVHASSFSLEHIGRTYRDYVRFMDYLDRTAPGLVHHVRYEELVERPEATLRPAFDYLGLPWDDAVLSFYKTDRNIRTPSAEQVRRPLNREGIGAWKPYQQWLSPLFEALGPLAEEELAQAGG